MGAGPVGGRSGRATAFRALLPCLALTLSSAPLAQAQTVTPDLFSPTRSSQITTPDSPLRRTTADANDKTSDAANDARLRDKDRDTRGALAHRSDPELWPAGSERRLKLRLRLAQPQAPEAEILSGPGQAETTRRSRQSAAACDRSEHGAAAFDPAVGIRQQDTGPAGDGRHRSRPAAAQAAQDRR